MSSSESILMLKANYQRLRHNEATLKDANGNGAVEAPLPELTPVIVKVHLPTAYEPGRTPTEGAWAKAVALSHQYSGWARRQSGVWWRANDENGDLVSSSDFDLDDPLDGPPIWGEWVVDDGTESHHLRPSTAEIGSVCLWRYNEQPLQATEMRSLSDGEFPALAQDVEAIWAPLEGDSQIEDYGPNSPIVRRVCRYRIYWSGTNADPFAIRRVLTRFAGFGSDDVRLRERVGERRTRPTGNRI